MGRIGDKSAVPELLKALGELSAPDRILEHSLTYALIEVDDPKGTSAGLASDQPRVRRAALAALDQMDQGGLDSQQVAGYLSSSDASLKETSSWIIGRHPEWAGALAGFSGNRLKSGKLSVAEQTDLERSLRGSPPRRRSSHSLAERTLRRHGNPVRQARQPEGHGPIWFERRACIVDTRRGERSWWRQSRAGEPGRCDGPDVALQQRPGPHAHTLPARDRQPPRRQPTFVSRRSLPFPVDLAMSNRRSSRSCSPSSIPSSRPRRGRRAVNVVSRARLTSAQFVTLADRLKTAGPLDVDRLLTAFEQTTDESLGLKLVKALGESSALSSLRVDAIKQHLAKFGPPVQTAAQALYAKLNVDAAKQKAKVDELMTKVSSGDVRRGQLAFHSEKAACFTCHAIGYRGGDVGPDLTKVGQIRSERDLLEAILYPGASFIRSYEPVVVATADGKVQNGLLKNETSEEILLVTGANHRCGSTDPTSRKSVPAPSR